MKQFFRFRKAEDVMVIHGSGESVIEKKQLEAAEIFYYLTLFLLLGSLVFSFLSTGDLVRDHEVSWREQYRLMNEKKSLQANLESLEQLSKRVDTIKKEQAVIEQALPFQPWNEQVMSFIEDQVYQIRKKTFLDMPETISWRIVSASEISNDELADLEVYQYPLSLSGTYEGVMSFIKSLRGSLRLLDLISMNNFRQDSFGNVSVDLVFWAYNLPNF